MTIRYVNAEDHDFWFSLDRHLSENVFQRKERDQMGYVLIKDSQPVGILAKKVEKKHGI